MTYINKKLLFFIIFCTIVLSLYTTFRVDAPNYELKQTRHTTIIDNSIEYPYKYRLLNPFIAEVWFSIISNFLSDKTSLLGAYFIQNILVFLFLFYSLYKFLSLWFEPAGTVISALIFSLIIPLTITGYDILGDMTTAGIMALGFYFINTDRVLFLYPLVFIGAFNELQAILLIPFYFIAKKGNHTDKTVLLNSFLLILTFLAAYGIIYFLRGGAAGTNEWVWYFTKDASFNIANKEWIVLWSLLFIPLLIFAIRKIAVKPEFLRRSLFTVIPAFYLIAFFFIARLREMDKALTIFLIMIPLAVISLFPSLVLKKES